VERLPLVKVTEPAKKQDKKIVGKGIGKQREKDN
jgi:hypothetical protein